MQFLIRSFFFFKIADDFFREVGFIDVRDK